MMQDSIDAVASAQNPILRLNVNITGSFQDSNRKTHLQASGAIKLVLS